MARARDSQRSKVYKAQRVIDGKSFFNSVPKTQAYVDKITRSVWWKKQHRGYIKTVKVKDGRRRKRASAYGANTIVMPSWSRYEMVILHELAHCIVHSYDAPEIEAGHGRLYASLFLKIVKRFMGKWEHDQLKASFKRHRVKYIPKRGYEKILKEVCLNGMGDETITIKLLEVFEPKKIYKLTYTAHEFGPGKRRHKFFDRSKSQGYAAFHEMIGRRVVEGYLPKDESY